MAHDEGRDERLAQMQIADLGIKRASDITAVDTKANTRHVDLRYLEKTRAANQPGTIEYDVAQQNKDLIELWNVAYKDLANDGTDDGKEQLNDGQSHRLEMRRRLLKERDVSQRFDGSSYSQNKENQASIKGGRGGRAASGGRGGGVVGTRGRSDRRRRTSVLQDELPPPARSTNTRYNDNGQRYPLSSRVPLTTVIEESASRYAVSRISNVPTRSHAQQMSQPGQSRAYNVGSYNIGSETETRNMFRAAMSHHTPSANQSQSLTSLNHALPSNENSVAAEISITRVPVNENVTSTPSPTTPSPTTPSPTTKELNSSCFRPANVEASPDLEWPAVHFSAEIDSAPTRVRVQTPSPPSSASTKRSSSSDSYVNDLRGLDMPADDMDDRIAQITNEPKGVDANASDEELMSFSDEEGEILDVDNQKARSDSSKKVDVDVRGRSKLPRQISSSTAESPAPVSAQALLLQLLAMPVIASSPEVTQVVTQLQASINSIEVGKGKTSTPNIPSVSTGQRTADAVNSMAAGLSASIYASRRPGPASSTNHGSRQYPKNVQSIPIVLAFQARTYITESAITNSAATHNEPAKPARFGSELPISRFTETDSVSSPALINTNIVPSSTGFASRLGAIQATWKNAQIARSLSVVGDLHDSDYSTAYDSQKYLERLRSDQSNAAIIGNHLLPAGWHRSSAGIQSSATLNPLSSTLARAPYGSNDQSSHTTVTILSQGPANHMLQSNLEQLHAPNSLDEQTLSGMLESVLLDDKRQKLGSFESSASRKLWMSKEGNARNRIYSIPDLLVTRPELNDPEQMVQTQSTRASDHVARRLNGVPLGKEGDAFANRPAEQRAQTYPWLPLTRRQNSQDSIAVVSLHSVLSPLAAAPSTNISQGSSSTARPSVNSTPTAHHGVSAPANTPRAQFRDTAYIPNNATTRQYAYTATHAVPAPTAAVSAQIRDTPYIPNNAATRQYYQPASSATRSATARPTSVLTSTLSIVATDNQVRDVLHIPDSTISRQYAQHRRQAELSPLANTFVATTKAHRDPTVPTVDTVVSALSQQGPASTPTSNVFTPGIGRSMWGNAANEVQITARPETLQSPALVPRRTNLQRPANIRASSEIFTDPDDTSHLFRKYTRPHGNHRVPAFIAATSDATQATDPGAAARAQYGLGSRARNENQPIFRPAAKSDAGSEASGSKREQGPNQNQL